MTFLEKHHEVDVGWKTLDIVRYNAHIDWADYDKIFTYLRWRTPVRYEPYGSVMRGIVATYADGTSERMSWIQLRDVIDKNWYHLKKILMEDGGEDLDRYTERQHGEIDRIFSGLRGETLTLKCVVMTFRTHTCGACPFNRIWGTVMY